jgi:predicted nucleotidyltransferase
VRELPEILRELRALKGELRQRYRVTSLEVFGSTGRGEHGPASDLDLLVEFGEDADLFDQIGLEQFLCERLNMPVDVVPKRSLRKEFREEVLREAIAV